MIYYCLSFVNIYLSLFFDWEIKDKYMYLIRAFFDGEFEVWVYLC